MSMDIDEPFKPQDEKMIEDIINTHKATNTEEIANTNDAMLNENMIVNEQDKIKEANPPKLGGAICKALGVDPKGSFGSLLTSRLVMGAICTTMGWKMWNILN